MSMKGFTIRIRNGNEVSLELGKARITNEELLNLALTAVELAADVTYRQVSPRLNPDKDPKIDKELRANIYDKLVMGISHITNKIYPEHVDLYKKTPEALLEETQKEIKKLNELKANQQKQAPVS